MVTDVRKALDRVAERAGFAKGSIRLQKLRHTYTAARIQSTDRGQPIALYTVARELGHQSTSMIENRYGHLHERPVDPEVVSFTTAEYQIALSDRLKALDTADR